MKAKIYFEGDNMLRSGFRVFFDKYFNHSGKKIDKLIACQATPIEDFLDGIRDDSDTNSYHILLIDADVLPDNDYRKSVRETTEWKKHCETEIDDNQLHFMVQLMEAWFIADKDALKAYFGEDFKTVKLPKQQNVEEIPAKDVIRKLNEASRNTKRRTYSRDKAMHGSRILTLLDPHKVIEAAPHCKALFETLKSQTKG